MLLFRYFRGTGTQARTRDESETTQANQRRYIEGKLPACYKLSSDIVCALFCYACVYFI